MKWTMFSVAYVFGVLVQSCFAQFTGGSTPEQDINGSQLVMSRSSQNFNSSVIKENGAEIQWKSSPFKRPIQSAVVKTNNPTTFLQNAHSSSSPRKSWNNLLSVNTIKNENGADGGIGGVQLTGTSDNIEEFNAKNSELRVAGKTKSSTNFETVEISYITLNRSQTDISGFIAEESEVLDKQFIERFKDDGTASGDNLQKRFHARDMHAQIATPDPEHRRFADNKDVETRFLPGVLHEGLSPIIHDKRMSQVFISGRCSHDVSQPSIFTVSFQDDSQYPQIVQIEVECDYSKLVRLYPPSHQTQFDAFYPTELSQYTAANKCTMRKVFDEEDDEYKYSVQIEIIWDDQKVAWLEAFCETDSSPQNTTLPSETTDSGTTDSGNRYQYECGSTNSNVAFLNITAVVQMSAVATCSNGEFDFKIQDQFDLYLPIYYVSTGPQFDECTFHQVSPGVFSVNITETWDENDDVLQVNIMTGRLQKAVAAYQITCSLPTYHTTTNETLNANEALENKILNDNDKPPVDEKLAANETLKVAETLRNTDEVNVNESTNLTNAVTGASANTTGVTDVIEEANVTGKTTSIPTTMDPSLQTPTGVLQNPTIEPYTESISNTVSTPDDDGHEVESTPPHVNFTQQPSPVPIGPPVAPPIVSTVALPPFQKSTNPVSNVGPSTQPSTISTYIGPILPPSTTPSDQVNYNVKITANCGDSDSDDQAFIHIITDLQLSAIGYCKDDVVVPFYSNDTVNFYLPVVYDEAKTVRGSCVFIKKKGSRVYNIRIEVSWGERDDHIHRDKHFQVTCTYDDAHLEKASGISSANTALIAPYEIASHGGRKTQSRVHFDVVDVLGHSLRGKDIAMGRPIRLKGVVESSPGVKGLRPVSCYVEGTRFGRKYAILTAGCGDGILFSKDHGFQTKGLETYSPYISTFTLGNDNGIEFDCEFTLCEKSCDGSSCTSESKRLKRRSIEEFMHGIGRVEQDVRGKTSELGKSNEEDLDSFQQAWQITIILTALGLLPVSLMTCLNAVRSIRMNKSRKRLLRV